MSQSNKHLSHVFKGNSVSNLCFKNIELIFNLKFVVRFLKQLKFNSLKKTSEWENLRAIQLFCNSFSLRSYATDALILRYCRLIFICERVSAQDFIPCTVTVQKRTNTKWGNSIKKWFQIFSTQTFDISMAWDYTIVSLMLFQWEIR